MNVNLINHTLNSLSEMAKRVLLPVPNYGGATGETAAAAMATTVVPARPRVLRDISKNRGSVEAASAATVTPLTTTCNDCRRPNNNILTHNISTLQTTLQQHLCISFQNLTVTGTSTSGDGDHHSTQLSLFRF